jgi:hypothetical protein
VAETLEQRAVARCTDEIARASMYLCALRGLDRANSYNCIDFVQLASWAMYDQMIGHACKVLLCREREQDYDIWSAKEKAGLLSFAPTSYSAGTRPIDSEAKASAIDTGQNPFSSRSKGR